MSEPKDDRRWSYPHPSRSQFDSYAINHSSSPGGICFVYKSNTSIVLNYFDDDVWNHVRTRGDDDDGGVSSFRASSKNTRWPRRWPLVRYRYACFPAADRGFLCDVLARGIYRSPIDAGFPTLVCSIGSILLDSRSWTNRTIPLCYNPATVGVSSVSSYSYSGF